MTNSAIRIPIPGSVIDAVNANNGDLLYFNATQGQGGRFISFKPLIQDLRPFNGTSRLDFYVSTKSESETSSWEDATTLGMTLASGLDGSNRVLDGDIRLGINLDFGRPTHTLEVVGDMMIWGRESEAGNVLGRIKFYSNETNSGVTPETLVFGTPLKNHSNEELNSIQSRLQAGRLLVRHPDTKDTYFARLQDIVVPGNGVTVNNNIISVGDNFENISSPRGITLTIDTDKNAGENEAFKIVERVSGPLGLELDFPLLQLVRAHGSGLTWNQTANQFTPGNSSSQGWPTVKFGIGTGSRSIPNGMLVEDGVFVTGTLSQEEYDVIGAKYARLFGEVATDPTVIAITGNPSDPQTAFYVDTGRGVAATEPQNDGRFGFLLGFESMNTKGGFADPGSFVAGYLNKHPDGGGVKVKVGDTDGDEFALFMENSNVAVNSNLTGGERGELSARHLTIVENTELTGVNDQYRNILAQHAPVFTVRGTTGDTFVRGFLVMPFLPGIQSDVNGKPTLPGAENGVVVLSTHENPDLTVSMVRYQWDTTQLGGAGDWVPVAEYKLPKGTVYCDANGNVKICRVGGNIRNHGLDGVTSWSTSD